MRRLFNSFLVLLFITQLSACSNEDQDMEINYLLFEFQDSSVPPPYHRSYSLEFKGEDVHIIVDSYGDVLTDTIINLGAEKIEKALDLVNKYDIRSKDKNSEDEGCSGGTGIAVEFGKDEKQLVNGYVYFCAGEQFGNLSGDLQALKSSLKELIPNFSQYLK